MIEYTEMKKTDGRKKHSVDGCRATGVFGRLKLERKKKRNVHARWYSLPVNDGS